MNSEAKQYQTRSATLIGAAGVVLWSTETALIKAAGNLPPFELVALAFAFAALSSLAIWLWTGATPLVAIRQPKRVWLLTIVCLVGYHSCLYYAVERAPATPAALLQGCTPLVIVLGSVLLPSERVRWWHIAGLALGLAGTLAIIGAGGEAATPTAGAPFYLAIVGVAAALWGVYSLILRSFSEVPTAAMGLFFGASAIVAGLAHLLFESWHTPAPLQWLPIAAIGFLPMGLALYFWDHGVKRGDIQALGVFSYGEPFFAAAFVVWLGQGELQVASIWGGLLVVGGVVLASRGIWRSGDATRLGASAANSPQRQILTLPRAELSASRPSPHGAGTSKSQSPA